MNNRDEDAFSELSAYTLAHGGRDFIHQYVVDAYAAQTAGAEDKPIRLTMALVGLYLHVEHRLNGKQVQRVHQLLANAGATWPAFHLPVSRGAMNVRAVLAEDPGPSRDDAIDSWCRSAWSAFEGQRATVEAVLDSSGISIPNPGGVGPS